MTSEFTEEVKKKYLQDHQKEIQRLSVELFMLIHEHAKRVPMTSLEVIGIAEGLKSFFLFDLMKEYNQRLKKNERKTR